MTHIAVLEHELELLCAHAPELRDKALAKEFYAVLIRGAREYGFTKQDIDEVRNHRVILLLRDAMIYQGLWKPVWEAA